MINSANASARSWRTTLRELWDSLFQPSTRPTAFYEALFLVVMVRVLRDALHAATRSAELFKSFDAFLPESTGLVPAGWAAWMPVSLVLSHNVDRFIAVLALASGLVWLLKRGLGWSPWICAISYGLLMSLRLSRGYYNHSMLPGAAMLIVFAAFAFVRRRQIQAALHQHDYWSKPIYPNWVFVSIVAYFGFLYTASGFVKLTLGGLDAFNGLALQLYLSGYNGGPENVPFIAQPLIHSRLIATLTMSSVVFVEAGAIVAFAIKRLRGWWALCLMMFNIGLCLAMGQSALQFLIWIVALAWIAVADQNWFLKLFTRPDDRSLCIRVANHGSSVKRFAFDLLYRIDVFGWLRFHESV